MGRVPADQGMLCHLIKHARPDLVAQIAKTQTVETIVVGLGRQGTRHAGMMRDFGTTVTAGIAAGRGGTVLRFGEPTPSAVHDGPVLATGLVLYQNQPNPFNPSTRIRFEMPRPGHVRLAVYDVVGRFVTSLIDGPVAAGPSDVTWNGQDQQGRGVRSGVYFYRLESRGLLTTRKMVLIK